MFKNVSLLMERTPVRSPCHSSWTCPHLWYCCVKSGRNRWRPNLPPGCLPREPLFQESWQFHAHFNLLALPSPHCSSIPKHLIIARAFISCQHLSIKKTDENLVFQLLLVPAFSVANGNLKPLSEICTWILHWSVFSHSGLSLISKYVSPFFWPTHLLGHFPLSFCVPCGLAFKIYININLHHLGQNVWRVWHIAALQPDQ